MKLRTLPIEDVEVAFESYAIPDYVLETIPKCYRKDITGAVWELIEGELGQVWLTESNAPYMLAAEYHGPGYWCLDDGADHW